MKKVFTSVIAVLVLTVSFAAKPNSNPTPLYASQIMFPVGKAGQKISLLELSTISKVNLEKMSGKKMSGAESFAFKSAQRKMNRGINSEGVVTSKRMKKMFYAGETGFHVGGFALGFLVGLVGVLIAYLINDDYKKNRVKWAWIGLGAGIILGVLLFLAVYSGSTI
jgi:hypothetical protein